MRRKPLLVATLFAFCFSSSQSKLALAQQAPQNETGVRPWESYDGVRENLNLATGGLSLQIPLLKLPGRNGFDYSVSLDLNNQIWAIDPSTGQWKATTDSTVIARTGDVTFYLAGGLVPFNSDVCGMSWQMRLEDGSVHSFSGVRMPCFNTTNPNNWVLDPGAENRTGSDDMGEGYSVALDPANGNCYLRYKDGSSYSMSCTQDQGGGTTGIYEDSNGNEITGSGTTGDTLGRVITINKQQPSWLVQYKDSNGVLRTFTVNITTVQVNPGCVFPVPGGVQPTGSIYFPSSLVLPDGLTYIFQHDACGALTKVTYPSGGYTRYDYDYQHYQNKPHLLLAPVTYVEMVAKHVCRAPAVAMGSTSTGTGNTCPAPYTEDTTTYSPTVNGTLVNNSANTVTDPLGNVTSYQFSQGRLEYPNTIPPVETSHTIYQGASTLLRTVNTVSTTSPPITPTSKTTILPNGLRSKMVWVPSAERPTEVQEYAYGQGVPGALVRKTDYTYGTGWCSYHKTSEVVYDGSGTQIAKTSYELDNYTAGISASGATQHDPALNTSFTGRCNVTAIKVWRNTDGATLTTRMQYDDAGNVVSATDPLNHTTTTSYADVWGDATCTPTGGNAAAYPTQVTGPTGLTKKSSYNSCTGTPASATDPNNKTASFSYDLMDRPTVATLPDTGQTSTCFSEISGSSCYSSAYPLKAVRTQKLTSSIDKTSTTVLDGLARVSQSQLNSDPDCAAAGGTKVDTTYDGAENKSTVTNAYCTTSDATYGLTTYQYDGLHRSTKVIPPDGTSTANNVSTSYDILSTATTPPGNCSTGTDQTGRTRKSCSDAQGRLTQVYEDPSTLNYETDYTYDWLNNLLRIDQKGGSANSANWRTRTFAYNSLSQLLCSANPELAIATCLNPDNGVYTAGTIRYAYDNNGNLLTKTSPKPNQSSPSTTTVTTFSYDVLNRLTQKSYNDGLTPTVSYGYDGVLISCATPIGFIGGAAQNELGRRSSLCWGTGSKSWQFDAMGRPTNENFRQIGTTNLMGGNTEYQYYLDGAQLDAYYPNSPTVTLIWGRNAAGNIVTVDDAQNYFLRNAHYTPGGGLASANFNGANTVSNTYNKRLQPVTLTAATPTGTSLLNLTYDFHLGAGDNGNVFQVANGRDATRTQNFTYDSLNRIKQANTTSTSGSHCWGEVYTIDAWGNLTNRAGVSGMTGCQTEGLSTSATVNNRLSGFTYDAAGNLMNDGAHNYTYDAENRILNVDGTAWTYTYDSDGQRVKKCTGSPCTSGTVYFRNIGDGSILQESNLAGTFQNAYATLGGRVIGRVDLPAKTPNFYLVDHLGSTSVIVNASGTITKEADYFPYGGEIPIANGDSNHYKFTGKERDAESGLDDFGARFDASSLGRFMSPDQGSLSLGNPQSLNRYGFAFNNPLRFVDSDGNEVLELGTFVVTEYKNAEGGEDHSPLDALFAVLAAYGTTPETVKGKKYWEDKNGFAKGGMGPAPVRLPAADHPAEGWGESGAWFAESDQNWSVSVDFEPGCGAPSASIQFNQHPETGFAKNGSQSGFSFRTESQPESVSSAIRFNSLAGLSGSKLSALYDEASKGYMDSSGVNASQYFEIMAAVLGEMGKREKQEKPKCSANGSFGPGSTNGGSPYLGPPTATANGCKQ